MIKRIVPTAPGSGLEGSLSIHVYNPVNESSAWQVLAVGEDVTDAVSEPCDITAISRARIRV